MSAPRIDQVGKRAGALLKRKPFWTQPSDDRKSLLLPELYAEWLVHYFTALQTLIDLHGELAEWESSSQSDKWKTRMVDLGCGDLESLASALEARNIEAFFALSLSILESAAKITAFAPVQLAFEIKGVLDNIAKSLKSGKSELSAVDGTLELVEESMRTMLTLSLWTESTIGSISGRFQNGSKMAEWRRPIVARMLRVRSNLLAAEFEPDLLRFKPSGLWPSALGDGEPK